MATLLLLAPPLHATYITPATASELVNLEEQPQLGGVPFVAFVSSRKL